MRTSMLLALAACTACTAAAPPPSPPRGATVEPLASASVTAAVASAPADEPKPPPPRVRWPDVPRIVVDESLVVPITRSISPAVPGGSTCIDYEKHGPDVILEVPASLPDLRVAVKTPGASHLIGVAWAPPNTTDFPDPSACAVVDVVEEPLSRPGVYGIRVAGNLAPARGDFSILIFREGSREPLAAPAPVGNAIPLADRDAENFYPLLLLDDAERPVGESRMGKGPAPDFARRARLG